MLTQWEKIQAARRMQEYIEARLDERITMAALANAARYSQWHASRLFKEITGKAPFEYIRQRRLSEAAIRLRDGAARVVDVAFDFTFDSHEGFTRAFSKQFGVPPSRYRRGGSTAALFLPPQLRDWYARRQQGESTMTEKTATVFVQVLDRPARKLLVKRARTATHYFEYCEEVGCDVWEQLCEVREALGEPMGLWLPAAMVPTGTSTYVQGVELPVEYAGPAPDGLDLVDLPPCKMMVFQGPPYDDKDFEQAITSLWDAINAYRPETFGYRWADELAPRFQLRPEGHRGYIEGRPVRTA